MNILLNDLSVRAGKRMLIKNISTILYHGQITAVIGENGSGKSTLIKAVAGLSDYSAAELLYGETPLKKYKLKALARTRAVVLQNPAIPPGTIAGELLALARYAFNCGKTADRAAIEKAVQDAGCADFLNRRLETLSGGELRRVYLACALAQEPEILFLDEAEANTDAVFRASFPGLLKRLQQERQLTVIMVTHDLDLALNTADRIIGLKSGELGIDVDLSAPDAIEKLTAFTGKMWDFFPGKDGTMRALPGFSSRDF